MVRKTACQGGVGRPLGVVLTTAFQGRHSRVGCNGATYGRAPRDFGIGFAHVTVAAPSSSSRLLLDLVTAAGSFVMHVVRRLSGGATGPQLERLPRRVTRNSALHGDAQEPPALPIVGGSLAGMTQGCLRKIL